MIIIYLQLDFKPADIKHSSLRTMAKHVRRAMLSGNNEVFKKSFPEGIQRCRVAMLHGKFPIIKLALYGRIGWQAGS